MNLFAVLFSSPRLHLFFWLLRRLPASTLFPYTTLFRSMRQLPRTMGSRQLRHLACPLGERSGQVPQLPRSEEHTSELQSLRHLVCRLLLEKKNSKER